MKNEKLYNQINKKLEDIIARRYVGRVDDTIFRLLLKIDWCIKFKKLDEQDYNNLLDKLEFIQQNVIY